MSTEDVKTLFEKPMSDQDRALLRLKVEHIANLAVVFGADGAPTKGSYIDLERMVDLFHDQAWRDGRRAGMAHALTGRLPVPEPLATVHAEPVDRKHGGEMRQIERAAFRTLAGSVLTDDNPLATTAAIEELEKWVDAFGRDRVTAGIEYVYDDAESGIDRPAPTDYELACPFCGVVNRARGFKPETCGNCGASLITTAEPVDLKAVPVFEPIEEAPAATADDDDLRCPVCGSLEREALDDGGAACVACGNQYWPEPEPEPSARASHHDSGFVSATEYTNALNKAYSDGYKTGHMHGVNLARWIDGAAISGPEPVEEPSAETPLVYVTVSKKGRITASGPAPDVLAVLRGVLELEDEEPAPMIPRTVLRFHVPAGDRAALEAMAADVLAGIRRATDKPTQQV